MTEFWIGFHGFFNSTNFGGACACVITVLVGCAAIMFVTCTLAEWVTKK